MIKKQCMEKKGSKTGNRLVAAFGVAKRARATPASPPRKQALDVDLIEIFTATRLILKRKFNFILNNSLLMTHSSCHARRTERSQRVVVAIDRCRTCGVCHWTSCWPFQSIIIPVALARHGQPMLKDEFCLNCNILLQTHRFCWSYRHIE